MKRLLLLVGILISSVLLLSPVSPARAGSPVIVLLNPPPGDELVLDVGESYTFDVQITSNEPFILAMAMSDAYYPGRGVVWHGHDLAHHTTSATLHLTITGKDSTADLQAVCDWPEPGVCWPVGVAPISLAAGVRYKRGVINYERFNFAVVVP